MNPASISVSLFPRRHAVARRLEILDLCLLMSASDTGVSKKGEFDPRALIATRAVPLPAADWTLTPRHYASVVRMDFSILSFFFGFEYVSCRGLQ